MSLTDKLRELAELQTKLRSETCMGVPWADRDRAFRDACTLTNFAALLADAERLEEKIWSLEVDLSIREGDLNDARETIEAAGENPLDADLWATMKAQRDKAIEKADRLEAQNARLRELVRSAYTESWGELSPNEYREEYWEQSAAKAALDKEGSDA